VEEGGCQLSEQPWPRDPEPTRRLGRLHGPRSERRGVQPARRALLVSGGWGGKLLCECALCCCEARSI
jgi:hypothetical protein